MCRRSNSFLQSGLPIGDDDELGAIVLTSGDRQDAAIFGYVHGEALANRGFNQSRLSSRTVSRNIAPGGWQFFPLHKTEH